MTKQQEIVWIKKGKMGNWLAEWIMVIQFEKVQIEICRITQFRKGEYCLPQSLFPRDQFFNIQKTKSLRSAKNKCESFLRRLSIALNNYFK